MTPTEIREALALVGGQANKRLGQHFLIDTTTLAAIVEAADVKPGDRVLEIGPGLGVLTRTLLAKGAQVIAIEQDRRMVEYLTTHAAWGKAAVADGTLRVIHGDAASLHWHEAIGDGTWKLVSNLPYSITSLALRKAVWAPLPPACVVVLIQREVAERAIAKDGDGSLLSLMVALGSAETRMVRRVPAGAFFPPPKVESAVLRIVPTSWKEREATFGIHPDRIMEVAKRGFAHPRKLLRSNLGLPEGVLTALQIPEKARSETLSLQEWAGLARWMKEGEVAVDRPVRKRS